MLPEILKICTHCEDEMCIIKDDSKYYDCHKEHPESVTMYHPGGKIVLDNVSEADDTITLKVSDLLKIIRGVTS